MSLALSLGGSTGGKEAKEQMKAAMLKFLADGGQLEPEDVDAFLALTKAIEEGAEIPPEAIRFDFI